MSAPKKVKSPKVVGSSIIELLVNSLKVDAATVGRIVALERVLMSQKAEKLSGKCKVTRQRMRTLKFHRHEHTAETIAQIQKLASVQ